MLVRRIFVCPSSISLGVRKSIAVQQSFFPRRYYIDGDGRRVLIGLSVEETKEFEFLEEPDGSVGLSNETKLKHRERWLELYRLHQLAWEKWRAKTSPAEPLEEAQIKDQGLKLKLVL